MEVLYGFETGEAKRDNTRTLHPTQPPFAFGSGGWWVLTLCKENVQLPKQKAIPDSGLRPFRIYEMD